MGKRSDFERVERDFYKTPLKGLQPLLPHLCPGTKFIEPCAGDGTLVDMLVAEGHRCLQASDIWPQRFDIHMRDALGVRGSPEAFITNPPWDRKILHPLITHLSDQAPTWLLFDADWAHTKQARLFADRLRKVVSVGRLIWIPGTKMTGKENCAWYCFDRPAANQETAFYMQAAA